jgi:hypothetical protein
VDQEVEQQDFSSSLSGGDGGAGAPNAITGTATTCWWWWWRRLFKQCGPMEELVELVVVEMQVLVTGNVQLELLTLEVVEVVLVVNELHYR